VFQETANSLEPNLFTVFMMLLVIQGTAIPVGGNHCQRSDCASSNTLLKLAIE
jgi:hypothetical protein